ncbi:MAG: alpha/beta hydrolase [Phycisphaerae bacterium]|nr:alpha/beta hydrolase [Phycisphaerae bacterium]
MRMRGALGAALISAAASMCGVSTCPAQELPVSSVRSPTDLEFQGFDGAWPARLAVDPAAPLGVVRVLDQPIKRWAGKRRAWNVSPEESDWRDAAAYTSWIERTRPGPHEVKFEDSGAFVIDTSPGDGDRPVQPLVRPTEYLQFASAQSRDGRELRIERTWFAYYDAPAGASAKGVVVFLPGLLGTPPGTIEQFIRSVNSQGWAVLRMLAQPSRFLERIEFEIDPRQDLGGPGRVIAGVFDHRIGECGFAVEAAMNHLVGARPALASLPRVAVGFSGGAITLPAVVARESSAYAGAAMIAGGADFFLITVQSSYTPMLNAVKYRWRDRAPSAAEVAALDREYLKASKLDPYNACAVLVGKPLLMIQGGADSAVPAHAGDLLWERLGRPERMVVPLTHELLFAKLPAEFSRIERWMSDVADSWRESRAGSSGGPTSSAPLEPDGR